MPGVYHETSESVVVFRVLPSDGYGHDVLIVLQDEDGKHSGYHLPSDAMLPEVGERLTLATILRSET